MGYAATLNAMDSMACQYLGKRHSGAQNVRREGDARPEKQISSIAKRILEYPLNTIQAPSNHRSALPLKAKVVCLKLVQLR